MRTKTILTAAAGMLCAASALAVTSVNVVGYVNTPVVTGFNLLVNPLQGANNSINTILPTVPDYSVVQKWDKTLQQFDPNLPTFLGVGIGWDLDITLAPGEAFFLQASADSTITFVGDVRQSGAGTLDTTLVPGFNFVGSQVPQSGGITSALGFIPSETDYDVVQMWVPASQAYSPTIYTYLGGGIWDPSEPVLGVGTTGLAEGAIIQRASAGSWSRNFNVQ